jgi:hypothetical protein
MLHKHGNNAVGYTGTTTTLFLGRLNAMYKNCILIMIIVSFAAGLAYAADIPTTGETKCYNGIVEIPCPQPGDDSSSNYGLDSKPLLPHTGPGNEISQDNATALMWQNTITPGDSSSGKEAQDSKPQRSYTDLGNGIIQDNFTGLMWQKATAPGIRSGDFPDRYTWKEAHTYCADLSLGGYTDWRLPDVNELQSLMDYSRYNPAINTTYFPKTLASRYWSSTMFSIDTNGAWYVSFYYGYAQNCIKESHYYVRAVRSGQ